MSDETTLLSCPFCWGEARPVKQIEGRYAIARYSVSCDGCGIVAFYEATEAEAIAAWNARAAKPCYATDHTHDGCKYSVNRGWVENVAHGTLTAEQVRKAVEGHGNIMDNRLYENWQAVADELNARLGSEREKALESLLRDWRACDPRCTNRSCGDCEHDEDDGCGLYRRMCELGVIA